MQVHSSFTEGNPFEKGFSLRLPSENFYLVFPGMVPYYQELMTVQLCFISGKEYHSGKNKNKVFGKGFGEEPFLRKVCPDNYVFTSTEALYKFVVFISEHNAADVERLHFKSLCIEGFELSLGHDRIGVSLRQSAGFELCFGSYVVALLGKCLNSAYGRHMPYPFEQMQESYCCFLFQSFRLVLFVYLLFRYHDNVFVSAV